MNRKLRLLLILLAGIGIIAGTAVPVLARSQHETGNPVPIVQQASGPTTAAPALKAPGGSLVRGTVQSVSGNVITLKSGATVTVDSNTKYASPKKKEASLADVLPGVDIVAQVNKTGTTLLAVRVEILGVVVPQAVHAGQVTAYTAGSSITIKDAKAVSFTFVITSDTKINYPKGVSQIKVGDEVTIAATASGDGKTLTAKVINVRQPPKVRLVDGSVATITSSSMTVKTATGDLVTVKLDADTIYTIKGKSAVEANDRVRVMAAIQTDGSLLAKQVLDGVAVPSVMKGFAAGQPQPLSPKGWTPGMPGGPGPMVKPGPKA